ncbi:PhoX family phosphatase [Sinimarinibacterium sp. CAU 1509]|uniref:PhoX family protein n=1 Tax=Sinimarinibacterium sp. CAU 1509 TaxID=2562283 RepID=UPI0010AD0C8A|nr:PhoX family phosphatase [Sinimarinibacterium sp. CAU 1509]TJY56613.1 PhoX family phosphatase [Sinimarinibacterium sp. CAU 1509]
MSRHDDEPVTNFSSNPHISDVLNARITRRQAVFGGLSATTAAMFGSVGLVGCSDDDNGASPKLGFSAVAHSKADFVSIPSGYSAAVLYALGDPIKAGIGAYSNAGLDADFDQRAGDHHDGMSYFPLPNGSSASDNGLLCINHENITQDYLHVAGATSNGGVRPQAEVLKEMNCHGVSVIEIKKTGGVWLVVQDSLYNRRITPFTQMELHGPLRNSGFAVTKYSTDGSTTRGTLNNCANGQTPWGTYLTCEENWAYYFKRATGDDANRNSADNALLSRYGINPGAAGNYGWTTAAGDQFQRLDITVSGASAGADYRNEAYTYGWIVEIDPYTPDSAPRKRSAMGRLGHEGCIFAPAKKGEPIVAYTGDDSRNEYIYKYVSNANWDPADAEGGLDAGDKYLNSGTLYVAKFNADGTGEWIALAYQSNGLDESNAKYPFSSQAAVMVGTRLAADSVGATKMDRPEWGAVHHKSGEVYFTLTNSSSSSSGRGQGGAGSQPVDAANPRSYDAGTDGNPDLDGNVNGHIIRWREDGGMSSSTTFEWDIFLFGARSTYGVSINVSGLTAANDFSSPDGLWFDSSGMLWIQTDDGAYTDTTNCMMLAAVPGKVGDGGEITIGDQKTYIGALPSDDTLRRFLVGPKECEITGITMTPDRKTMFVNIQHPGEDGSPEAPTSNWPSITGDATAVGTANSRPRSATIVITKDDSGDIAS